MFFRNRVKDPRQMMMTGMVFIALGLAWPKFLPVTGNLGPDAVDGMRGVLLGVGIGLSLWAAMLGGRLRRGAK